MCTKCAIVNVMKLAVMHYQFESIHPFYDGNRRTGRILNVLYLIRCGLLDSPILYLSRYIIRYKAQYYELLQRVRTESAWVPWIEFMITAVEETSRLTMDLTQAIVSYKAWKETIYINLSLMELLNRAD